MKQGYVVVIVLRWMAEIGEGFKPGDIGAGLKQEQQKEK